MIKSIKSTKSLSLAIIAAVLAAGLAPAMAANQATPTTKSACKKLSDMKWDATTKTCVKK